MSEQNGDLAGGAPILPAPPKNIKEALDNRRGQFLSWISGDPSKRVSDFSLEQARIKTKSLDNLRLLLILSAILSMSLLVSLFFIGLEELHQVSGDTLAAGRDVFRVRLQFLTVSASAGAIALVGSLLLLGRVSYTPKPEEKDPWEGLPSLVGETLKEAIAFFKKKD